MNLFQQFIWILSFFLKILLSAEHRTPITNNITSVIYCILIFVFEYNYIFKYNYIRYLIHMYILNIRCIITYSTMSGCISLEEIVYTDCDLSLNC